MKVFMKIIRYLCPISTKMGTYQVMLVKFRNKKIHKNPIWWKSP